MIYYTFNKSEGILLITVSGTFGINHMFKAIDSFSNVTLTEDELHLIIERLKSHLFKFNSIRHAVIHLDPVNTAFASLVAERLSGGNYFLKVFSNEEYALHWLNIV